MADPNESVRRIEAELRQAACDLQKEFLEEFETLSVDFTRWDTALWLVSPTGLLDGSAPIELMVSEPADVLLAAHYEWIDD